MKRIVFGWLAIFVLSACDNSAQEQNIYSSKQQALSENSNQNSAFWSILTLDSDGDGVSNWMEYLADKNPFDKSSSPSDNNNDSVLDVFVGPKGSKGDKGDTGVKGAKGDKGDTGDIGVTGATGSIGVTGAMGLQGPKGDIGAKGDTGATGAMGPIGSMGVVGSIGQQGPSGKDGKDCAKSCPTGSTSYYIGAQLVYCSAFIDLSVTANWAKCLEECAKIGLPISSASDLALMCLSNQNVFSAYSSNSIIYEYLASADYTTKTLQGTAFFMPGYTTLKPFNDGTKRSFCESVKYASTKGIATADYYFGGGNTGFSVANAYSISLQRSSSQYLSITDNQQKGLDLSGDFTFEMWVRLKNAIGSNQVYELIDKYAKDDKAYDFGYVDNDGIERGITLWLYGSIDDSYYWRESIEGSAINLGSGTWHHLAIAWQASISTAELFVDGVSMGKKIGTQTGIRNSSQPFKIGGRNEYFNGEIDDIRVWNIVRTSSEINNNRTAELSGNENGLVGYWKFNGSLNDATPNGNTLTNNNIATFSTDGANMNLTASMTLVSGCACGKRP